MGLVQGAWMQKQRDDKAVRRVRPIAESEVEVRPYDESLEDHSADQREDVEQRPM